MSVFLKIKERYITHKSYNIVLLRTVMYICAVIQLLWTLLPMALRLPIEERIANLIIIFVIFSLACIVGYIFEVFLFYIIFKKYVDNSVRTAEKQIAPLLFLKLLISFIFNLIGCFINIPSYSLTIEILQQLIAILYLGYIVFGNIFGKKCIAQLIIYLVANGACEIVADLMKTGISV